VQIPASIAALGCVLLGAGCGANEPLRPDNSCLSRDHFLCGRPLNMAHRGGANLRPENTLVAFSNAVAIGVDVLELDVQRTADDVVVVIHDATVDRTTEGVGALGTLTFADVDQLDAGYRFTTDGGATYPYRGMGIRVPTLEQVLAAFPPPTFRSRSRTAP
jgi:glycerophosphoryl diester phosphodiesterase